MRRGGEGRGEMRREGKRRGGEGWGGMRRIGEGREGRGEEGRGGEGREGEKGEDGETEDRNKSTQKQLFLVPCILPTAVSGHMYGCTDLG